MQVVKEAAVGLEIHTEVFLEVVPTPAAGIQDALFLGQFALLHLSLLGFALGTIPLGKSFMPETAKSVNQKLDFFSFGAF